MKITTYIILSVFAVIIFNSCQKTPSYCENKYTVEKIKLVPLNINWGGKELTIVDDSLIDFITHELCNINESETDYRTSSRGNYYDVEIILFPRKTSKTQRLIIAYDRSFTKSFILREGEYTFFKNETLCDSIAKLSEIYSLAKK